MKNDTKRVPTSHGTLLTMPINEANAFMKRLLDEQNCWWDVRRISDETGAIESGRFKTLREAMMWLLKYSDTMQHVGLQLIDMIPLASELNLLWGTALVIEEVEVPQMWTSTQTWRATANSTPQWCM
jgi:hypothetical protein